MSAPCRCTILCSCPDAWEFMRRECGYSREEMEAKLAPLRESQRALRAVLDEKRTK